MIAWPSLIKVVWPDSLYTKESIYKWKAWLLLKVWLQSRNEFFDCCDSGTLWADILVFSCLDKNINKIVMVLMLKRSFSLCDWPLCDDGIYVYKNIVSFFSSFSTPAEGRKYVLNPACVYMFCVGKFCSVFADLMSGLKCQCWTKERRGVKHNLTSVSKLSVQMFE